MKNILLGVTGSIAAYKACELVSIFRKKGMSVRCALSGDAEKFVTALTFETLTGKKAAKDLFALPDTRSPEHISLAEEADIVLIAPATADIIGKIASGICDDVLTCAVCASSSPVVIAPAMNDNMYRNPVLGDKIQYLRSKGYHFVDPVEGNLACGRKGIGHLAPLEEIVKKTEEVLAATCS
ncbi:MAG: phosphopantothenoylcysteine decarboxylase [Candidatus Omnitrophica bacterium]|nr:phosphopantothenoylcysteine decarboxylase [Candidatus Omnitrophota bacterium]